MTIEKMREEFEAWAAKQKCNLYPLKTDATGYCHPVTTMAWNTWKASRESLVIELPKVVGFEGAYDSMQDHELCPRMIDVEDADEVFSLCRNIEVREAIEAAGLKVK